jgi:hypothetical protein
MMILIDLDFLIPFPALRQIAAPSGRFGNLPDHGIPLAQERLHITAEHH